MLINKWGVANEKISSFSNGPDDDAHDGCQAARDGPKKW